MIKLNTVYKAFLEWRGDSEMIKLGIANKNEINRNKNWKFKDYYANYEEQE